MLSCNEALRLMLRECDTLPLSAKLADLESDCEWNALRDSFRLAERDFEPDNDFDIEADGLKECPAPDSDWLRLWLKLAAREPDFDKLRDFDWLKLLDIEPDVEAD